MVDEDQKLNVCETGEWKVTLGYKLPAKYVFHTVRVRVTNEYKRNDFYKSFSEKVLAYNVMKWCFTSSTVLPQKLCTLTIHPFLISLSCIIPFQIESPIMTVVPSGYFLCLSHVLVSLFVANGFLFLLPEFLNS